MNPYEFPFALLTFLAFVAVIPAWMWFVTSYGTVQEMSLAAQFLIGLTLPATVGFALVSWVAPGG
jgi:hypothetical protein